MCDGLFSFVHFPWTYDTTAHQKHFSLFSDLPCYTGAMKKYVLIAVALVVVAGGALTYTYIQNSNEAERQNAEQTNTSDSKDATDIGKPKTTEKKDAERKDEQKTPSVQPGAYVDYSSDAVANTDGTKLLFFHAPWCPQCQMVDADIKEVGVPEGVTVFKVDYDSNQKLRKKYGVTLQTTFVKIDDDGNLIDKFVAYNEPTFASVKENLL